MQEPEPRPATTPQEMTTTTATSAASCRVRSPYPSPAPGVAEQTGPGVPVEGEGVALPRRRLRQPALRAHRVCPRFSVTERAELQQAADTCRMPVGGYLAEAGLAAARADNPEAAVADHRRAVQELMASNRQAAAIGNNLNQLTRHLNANGPLPEPEVFHRLLAQVHDVLNMMDQAAEHLIRR
jgi:hypothetical protein